MSYIAITSNHPRHVKFLETLYQKIDLSVVVVVDKKISEKKFAEEQSFFQSDMSLLKKPNVLRCNSQQIHSNFVLNTLQKTDPKVGFVFGGPIIKKQLHQMPKFGCVNIHTGLVEHYRGVDSTLWALYDNNTDLIGTTLHYIDDSIDGGNIINAAKVKIEKHDNLDKLFYKTCECGFSLILDNIDDIISNKVKSIKLNNRGELYQLKDRNKTIVDIARQNLRRYVDENYC